MSLANDFRIYKEEIELIRAQNRVECDLYSIVASIVRERKSSEKISLRDVTTRRRTELSMPYFSDESGFPDFVVLEPQFPERVTR
jgi:hypothetical protein